MSADILERPQSQANAERADRILDAAGVLLRRLGYRKVTIEDIARQADIGKGTVYLHWRAKEQLFQALLLRESIGLIEELLQRLRADPLEILPHRYMRASFLAVLRRPLIFALMTGDTEMLSRFKQGPLREVQAQANVRYFRLMLAGRLLRADVPNLAYTMRAATIGFYLLENLDREGAALAAEAKADALAQVIRGAFEPDEAPDPARVAAAAGEFIALTEELITTFRAWIYEGGAS